ncbi:MAG: alcohol dehydrogenase catalytic domain-containing protein [Bacteroidales bacterium]|nr:alcohol dehydrogenase catalytic domain-containing protein [Bacteroidales bacterium]
MKAMKLTGIRQMEMMEMPDPIITNDTDVLIRMKSLGVCGSDIHYYTTGRIGSQVVQYPFIVGHEGAGEVLAVGHAVKTVKPGDRIAIEPAMPCWECDQCLAGRPHTCRRQKFLGCPGQAEGCLSELIVMPETSCFPIAASMSFEEAAAMEPLAIGVYATRLAGDLSNKKIGILGFGPIGMSVLLPALQKGITTAFVTDKIDARLKIADASGAHFTGNPDAMDVVAEVQEQIPEWLDIVFECCGQQEAADQAMKILKPGGKLVIVGIPEFDRWTFDADDMRRKEICIQNVRRQNHAVEEAHDLIKTGKVSVEAMITHRYSFQETKAAFDLVAAYEDGVMKAMIEF